MLVTAGPCLAGRRAGGGPVQASAVGDPWLLPWRWAALCLMTPTCCPGVTPTWAGPLQPSFELHCCLNRAIPTRGRTWPSCAPNVFPLRRLDAGSQALALRWRCAWPPGWGPPHRVVTRQVVVVFPARAGKAGWWCGCWRWRVSFRIHVAVPRFTRLMHDAPRALLPTGLMVRLAQAGGARHKNVEAMWWLHQALARSAWGAASPPCVDRWDATRSVDAVSSRPNHRFPGLENTCRARSNRRRHIPRPGRMWRAGTLVRHTQKAGGTPRLRPGCRRAPGIHPPHTPFPRDSRWARHILGCTVVARCCKGSGWARVQRTQLPAPCQRQTAPCIRCPWCMLWTHGPDNSRRSPPRCPAGNTYHLTPWCIRN